MTEAQAQGQATPEADATQEGEGQAQESTFTQKDVNKIAGQRAKEAEQRAINRLLEQTGYESLDDLTGAATEYRDIQSSVETEADKERKKAAKLEERAKTAEERYSSTLKNYALRDALRDAGIKPERIKGAMRLAETGALEIDSEGNVSGIEDVVSAVQEEAPEFFGSTERPRVNAPQTSGTGVSTPNGATPEDLQAQWLSQFIGQRQ